MGLVRNYKCLVDKQIYEKLKNGIFCVNKQQKFTSAQTLDFVKKILKRDVGEPLYKLKVGHGGTLDSPATGVLVIGTGDGTKKLTRLLSGNKIYEVVGKFGEETDTYDSVGKVTRSVGFGHITKGDLISCLEQFKGRLFQVPPLYCALKRRGSRISDLVSSGDKIVLPAREVECYEIQLLDFRPPYFSLKVSCGGGYYVRSLIHDIGRGLNSCAHVTDLCRLQQGPFTLEDCLHLEDLHLNIILSVVPKLQLKFFKYYCQ